MRFGMCSVAATAALSLLVLGCSDNVNQPIVGVGGGGGGGAGGGASSVDVKLPAATAACPTFVDGDVTFEPAGIAPRAVRIFMGPNAADKDGPLVFYWHGTGSSPEGEPPYGMGEAMDWVLDEGGIVVAPHADPAAGTFPWFLTTGGDNEADFVLADEVLACAVEQIGIDEKRIHSIGMSAGGLNTTQMSYRRSGYLASVVTFSGGKLGEIPTQEENNLFPAMIFHGGPDDVVIVNFQDLSTAYRDDLRAKGHFAFMCNHGGNHTIPQGAAQPSIKAFFGDHPWGTVSSPYENGLPAGFPTYCSLD